MGFCKVCTSPNRAAIDEAIAAGESQHSVARRLGVKFGSLNGHVRNKHPRAELAEDIGDEPVIVEGRGSYEWVMRQARLRGKRAATMVALTDQNDPFYFGSEADVEKGKWFAEAVVSRFEKQIKAEEDRGGQPHLRGLHYLCVTAQPPVLWPDGRVYENTLADYEDLNEWSKPARWLGFVDIERFADQRNAEPVYNAPEDEGIDVAVQAQSSALDIWSLPEINAHLSVGEWRFPNIWVEGYDHDAFRDQSCLVGVFIEKSTMDSWLRPLCEELEADLYVGSGFQSITNAVRFVKRATDLEKPAHLLVISDFDPTGRKMPIGASRHVDYRRRMVDCDLWITVDQVALTPEQIDEFNLPRAPIKKTDPGRTRFEKLFGRGAVELDALEALKPGAMENIVRNAIDFYRDDEIEARLDDAKADANSAIDEAWEEMVAPVQQEVLDARNDLRRAVAPFDKRLKGLNRQLQAKLKPFRRRLEKLRKRADDAVDDVVEMVDEQLPERPEPELIDLPEGEAHLFDTDRSYFENLASLHRFYPEVEKKKKGGLK